MLGFLDKNKQDNLIEILGISSGLFSSILLRKYIIESKFASNLIGTEDIKIFHVMLYDSIFPLLYIFSDRNKVESPFLDSIGVGIAANSMVSLFAILILLLFDERVKLDTAINDLYKMTNLPLSGNLLNIGN